MRHKVRFYEIAAAMLFVACAFTPSANADTQGVSNCGTMCNGYAFQATLAPLPTPPNPANTYSLSYTITNNNTTSANNAYAFSWSLTMFPNSNAISSVSNLNVTETGSTKNYKTDYQVMAGKSNNGSNGNCNSTVGGAICVTPNNVPINNLAAIGRGQSLTFSFDFVCSGCTELSSWDFLSAGKCVANTKSNCYSPSVNGTAVSEPPIWSLFASELLAAVVVVVLWRHRKLLTRNRQLWRSANTICSQ
jgi:hypothetical protein